MNEQSIENIIAYIQQYPDTPPEQLAENILQSGYKMDDLKEALRRQGISPIVIPGYVEPDPPAQQPFFMRMPVIIAGSIIGVLLIGLSVWAIVSPKKQEKKEEISGNIQQAVIPETTHTPTPFPKTPTPLITNAVSIPSATTEDPLKIFTDTFNAGDYKVTLDASEVSPAYGGRPAGNLHDAITMYSNGGSVQRLESEKSILIYKDTNIYNLDPVKKKYTVLSGVAPAALSFIPTILINESKNGRIQWEKITNSEWSGIWNRKAATGTYTTVTIVIDEKTHLLHKISTHSTETGSNLEIRLTYETISDTDSFMQIPAEYTKV